MKSLTQLFVALVLAFVATWANGEPLAPMLASGPCDNITGDPRPPIGEPEPLISGNITDADTTENVSGATVRLYRCETDGSTTLVDSESSDSFGNYSFTSLDGPEWYYVEVILTGPLSGMNAASGTTNPSNPLDVGPGDADLDFDFES